MSSLTQLRKEKGRLLRQKKRSDEESRLKRQIFMMKHGGKVKAIRKLGGTLRGYAEKYQANQGSSKSKSKNPFGKGSVFNPRSVWG